MSNEVYKANNDFSLYISGHYFSVLSDDIVYINLKKDGKYLVKIAGITLGWMPKDIFHRLFRELK